MLGVFYITSEREGDVGEFKVFGSPTEAILAFGAGQDQDPLPRLRPPRRPRHRDHRRQGPDRLADRQAVSWEHRQAHLKRLDAKHDVRADARGLRRQASCSPPSAAMIFNDILPPQMPYYNFPLTSKGASRVIADTYAKLGRPATINAARRPEAHRLQAAPRSPVCPSASPTSAARRPSRPSSTTARRRPTRSRRTTAWAPSPRTSATPSSSRSGATAASRSPTT